MTSITAKLGAWFWHLLPANPILVRVVQGASRRPRHLWLRFGYLVLLCGAVLISLAVAMSGPSSSLTDLAKGASQTFTWGATTQLALMCFLAPVFTAGAITQERDAQTFHILLATPLTSAQIVFGSLMSRLFFVIMLLVAGLPIFLMTMVYGGVTTSQIMESFLLSGSTAILTGSLAITVSMIRVGTRRTIFSFYLVIGLYLVALYMLGLWDNTWVEAAEANVAGRKMSWLAPLHPFLALDVALNRVQAPDAARLVGYSRIARYAVSHPSAMYVMWTLTLALLLTVFSMFFVRRGAKTGEPTIFTAVAGKFGWHRAGDRTRPPQSVWKNPVAWREARIKAGTGDWLRWVIVIAGFFGAVALFIAHVTGRLNAQQSRVWLSGIIMIQFAMALVIAANTAATSMTKEKESKSMDLLLTTLLTSRYILWGKLRGLVSYCLPLIGGPVVALLLFGVYGALSAATPPAIWIETCVEIAVVMVMYTACACVIGLKTSLHSKKTVTAVMQSVALILVVGGFLSGIASMIVREAAGVVGAFIAPFAPVTAVQYLVDSLALFDGNAGAFARHAQSARVAAVIGCAGAAALYAMCVGMVYRKLVRDFDMVMRKQAGT